MENHISDTLLSFKPNHSHPHVIQQIEKDTICYEDFALVLKQINYVLMLFNQNSPEPVSFSFDNSRAQIQTVSSISEQEDSQAKCHNCQKLLQEIERIEEFCKEIEIEKDKQCYVYELAIEELKTQNSLLEETSKTRQNERESLILVNSLQKKEEMNKNRYF
jgi:hypothetical protein